MRRKQYIADVGGTMEKGMQMVEMVVSRVSEARSMTGAVPHREATRASVADRVHDACTCHALPLHHALLKYLRDISDWPDLVLTLSHTDRRTGWRHAISS
jgi:hypothetical protein